MERLASLRSGPPGPPRTSRQGYSNQHALPVARSSPSFVICKRETARSLSISIRGTRRKNAERTPSDVTADSFRSYAIGGERSKLGAHINFTENNHFCHRICHCQKPDREASTNGSALKEESDNSWGVQVAIAVLGFYKREVSPLLPGSCRYVPTCSEYSIQAYKTYGVFKGTLLTACRLARCNPLGGSGFDPPRWFGEKRPPAV